MVAKPSASGLDGTTDQYWGQADTLWESQDQRLLSQSYQLLIKPSDGHTLQNNWKGMNPGKVISVVTFPSKRNFQKLNFLDRITCQVITLACDTNQFKYGLIV